MRRAEAVKQQEDEEVDHGSVKVHNDKVGLSRAVRWSSNFDRKDFVMHGKKGILFYSFSSISLRSLLAAAKRVIKRAWISWTQLCLPSVWCWMQPIN
jgi:hypothetical protein